MLRKLLIANRGEIAARIIRTARRLGVGTVLAVSDADRHSLAAAQADELVLIGPAAAPESYLRGDRIIEAARRTDCDSIHPGYGFLSENADFASQVAAAGLIFVGPTPEAMRVLGSKAEAKAVASRAGIPVVPGYQGDAQDAATFTAEADRIGYPVLIKAVHGGGGRGMRRVGRASDMAAELESAKREALAAFGSDAVLLEKLIERPRHIEVQVFGDSQGNVVHLFERDCSLQRRNQKVMEEAPAPGLSPGLREKMTAGAIALAKAVGYSNAGTVEFLVEPPADRTVTLGPDRPFYFIEANTRLQVEHPVTEEITGLDLVEWQLRVAAGEPLPLRQREIRARGHAVEVRLNAEDPANGFLPSIGQLHACEIADAGGLRVETGVGPRSFITPYYDSMIAKLIATGPDRAQALATVSGALGRLMIAGVRTNAAFLLSLVQHPDVASGRLDTGFIERHPSLTSQAPPSESSIAAAVRELMLRRAPGEFRGRCIMEGQRVPSPWDAGDAFQLGGERQIEVPFVIDGEPDAARATWPDGILAVVYGGGRSEAAGTKVRLVAAGERVFVVDGLSHAEVSWPAYGGMSDDEAEGDSGVRSPINGKVVKVLVAVGDKLDRGDRIAIVEAMKMEHVVTAPRTARVARVLVSEGQQVSTGTPMATLDGGDEER
ncbi:MAG: biotin carboxylase N-terminal domain-containing protein [Hyphomicrobiaceae bacterium]